MVIPNPVERPSGWISAAFPADSEDPEARLCSAGYQVRLMHLLYLPDCMLKMLTHVFGWPSRLPPCCKGVNMQLQSGMGLCDNCILLY